MASKINYVILTVVLILVVGALSLGLYVVLKGTNAKDATPIPTDTRVYETVTLPNYGISFELPREYEACEVSSEYYAESIADIWRDDSCNHEQDAKDFHLSLHDSTSKSLADIVVKETDYFGEHTNTQINESVKELAGREMHIITHMTDDPFGTIGIVAGVSIDGFAFIVTGYGIDNFYPYKQEFIERLLSTITLDKNSLRSVIDNRL